MPMPITHALVPLAAAIAFSKSPVPWRLVAVAAFAAAAPDLDGLIAELIKLPATSIYAHRGASHSLFVALAVGVIAAIFHRYLRVRPLTAAVVIAAAMASHGLLDMMSDLGSPVAYLWPLSSARLFADWRPIYSGPVNMGHLLGEAVTRFRTEFGQIILPMFVVALFARACIRLANKKSDVPESTPSHQVTD